MGAWASLPEAAHVAYWVLAVQQHDALGTFLAAMQSPSYGKHLNTLFLAKLSSNNC
jgi:hypothetical protein